MQALKNWSKITNLYRKMNKRQKQYSQKKDTQLGLKHMTLYTTSHMIKEINIKMWVSLLEEHKFKSSAHSALAQLWGQAHKHSLEERRRHRLPRGHVAGSPHKTRDSHTQQPGGAVAHGGSTWGSFQLFLVGEYLVLGGDSWQRSLVKIHQIFSF